MTAKTKAHKIQQDISQFLLLFQINLMKFLLLLAKSSHPKKTGGTSKTTAQSSSSSSSTQCNTKISKDRPANPTGTEKTNKRELQLATDPSRFSGAPKASPDTDSLPGERRLTGPGDGNQGGKEDPSSGPEGRPAAQDNSSLPGVDKDDASGAGPQDPGEKAPLVNSTTEDTSFTESQSESSTEEALGTGKDGGGDHEQQSGDEDHDLEKNRRYVSSAEKPFYGVSYREKTAQNMLLFINATKPLHKGMNNRIIRTFILYEHSCTQNHIAEVSIYLKYVPRLYCGILLATVLQTPTGAAEQMLAENLY